MNIPLWAKCMVCALLSFIAISAVWADGDVMKSFAAFQDEVAKKEAAQTQQQQMQRGGESLALQLRLLQAMIERADYEQAQQTISNLGGYNIDPELQAEWATIAVNLAKEMDRRKVESMEKWRREVDQLVKDSLKACLDARDSSDLDALLVRCAALQMRREQQDNVLGERVSRKLNGVANTLTAWTNYLDFKNTGNDKAANDALRSLQSNQSDFPVLSANDLQSHFVDAATPLDLQSALANALSGVKSPDDIPHALEKLQVDAKNPQNPELSQLRNEANRLAVVKQAWDAAQAGDSAGALRALDQVAQFGGMVVAQAYIDPLKDQIRRVLIEKKIKAWSALSRNPGEDDGAYLARILDDLQIKGNYATMSEVMKFSDQINANSSSTRFSTSRAAIDQYLAAQRFENAGDFLPAILSYRLVLGSSPDKYTPTQLAQDALKRLEAKYPDAFKSEDGAVLLELKNLRQQVLSRPYPYPYPGRSFP